MKKIIRYIYLELLFVKFCVVREMEYRTNLVISFLTVFIAYLTSALTYSVIFYNTDKIGNWTFYEVNFLVGTAAIVDGFFMSFLYFGLIQIPDMVRLGDLDFILLKPLNSMFMVSFRKFDLGTFFSVIVGIGANIVSLVNMKVSFQWWEVIIFYLMIFNGVIILYALFFISKCMSFYITKVDALDNLIWAIYEFGRRTPESVYKNFVRFLFIYLCPVLVVVNFPTGFILHKFGWGELGISYIITIVLLFISALIWKVSLRRYSSASS